MKWQRIALITVVACLGARPVLAASDPPEYSTDPFGDADLVDTPRILSQAHEAHGHFEVGVMFSTSMIDKYNSHNGGMIDINYNLFETLAIGMSIGMLHGGLTSIVKSPDGVLGNKMGGCLPNCDNVDITPQVPDYIQVTGVIDALAMWSPLYGKINVVSEIDVNLRLYLIGGFGVNGTRRTTAVGNPGATARTDFTLVDSGFGKGGFLSKPKGHVTVGAGLRIYLHRVVNLRAEIRSMFFLDKFDFDLPADGFRETYISPRFFAHVGLGFVVF